MNAFFKKEQFVMTFLASAALGLALALLTAGWGLGVFARSLARQAATVSLLWAVFGTLSYLGLTALSARWVGLRPILTFEGGPGPLSRKIFLAVCFLFPLGLILYVQLAELFGAPLYQRFVEPLSLVFRDGGNATIFASVLAGWLFMLTMLLVFRNWRGWETLPDAAYILLIVVIAAGLRLALLAFVQTAPYSDFAAIHEDALRLAQGQAPHNMYIATHVVLIVLYGFLYKVFGAGLATTSMFHLLCYALAGAFAYLAGRQVFGSRLWGGVMGLLLVTWPSLAFYSNVLTPEHLFILIECALLYALTLFFQPGNRGDDLPRYLLLGLLFGSLSLFRPFSLLYLLAFLITFFVYEMGIRRISTLAAGLAALLAAYWLVGLLPGALAAYYDNQFSKTRACNLLVGVNFDTAGIYNLEDARLCGDLQGKLPNGGQFNRAVFGLALERISDGRDQLAALLGRKMAVLWGDSTQILSWTVRGVPGWDEAAALRVVLGMNVVDFAVMLPVTLVCLVGSILAFFKDLKPAVFFSLLTFFGFHLMEAVFEIQTRYRTVVMPLLIFFFAWSLSEFGWLVTRQDRG